jgi:Domain of unknown function (DUF4365)
LARKKAIEKQEGNRKRNVSLKQRTRAHIIASLSANTIERYFLKKGHTVLKTEQDYGVDLVVFTHNDNGYVERGNISIQLKATDTPRLSADGTFYSFSISVKDYNAWSNELMPVFLILYDAKSDKAYWQYVQGYFESNTGLRPKTNATSITVRLPVGNEFNEGTVEYARAKKEALLEQLKGVVEHDL